MQLNGTWTARDGCDVEPELADFTISLLYKYENNMNDPRRQQVGDGAVIHWVISYQHL